MIAEIEYYILMSPDSYSNIFCFNYFSHIFRLYYYSLFYISLFYLGESISSDTSIGYSNEMGVSLATWQTCEENNEISMHADISVDPDAHQWLATNFSGMYVKRER